MAVKMLAGLGVTVVALAVVGSGATLALSGRNATPTAQATTAAAGRAATPVGCHAGTVDGSVLTEATQERFIASSAPAVLFQEPSVAGQPGSYWVLYPSTGTPSANAVKPPVSTWTPVDTAVARTACAPFLAVK